MTGQSADAVVIDASLALKWQLDDEEDRGPALALRNDLIIHRTLTAHAPTLFAYEMINGVVSAVKRKRMDSAIGARALTLLFSVEVTLHSPPVDDVYPLAIEHGLSAYDSAYVATARRLGMEFWTADRHLHDAVKAKLSWVRWIGEYAASGRRA